MRKNETGERGFTGRFHDLEWMENTLIQKSLVTG
jgi:hypothetical protein